MTPSFTWQGVHEHVASAMNQFTFTVPVTLEDAEAVRQYLQDHAVPAGVCTVTVEIVHPRFVRVTVTDMHGLNVYSQEHIVREPQR